MSARNPVRPGLYRHFKGQLYRVIEVARDSESEQQVVVYQALYGDKGWWVRPLSMFDERIERDGKKQRRFARCDEQTLSLEVVSLSVKAGHSSEFETAFEEAVPIVQGARGYLGHELRRCQERSGQYLLLIHWQTMKDHTEGFRQSDAYQRWRQLLHHFYVDIPQIKHYRPPLNG